MPVRKKKKKCIMDMSSQMILFSENLNSIYIPVFHLVSFLFFSLSLKRFVFTTFVHLTSSNAVMLMYFDYPGFSHTLYLSAVLPIIVVVDSHTYADTATTGDAPFSNTVMWHPCNSEHTSTENQEQCSVLHLLQC